MTLARPLQTLLLTSAIALALPAYAQQAEPTDKAQKASSEQAGTSVIEDDFAALYGTPADAQAQTTRNADPWEPYNRRMHRFNNAVDRTVARPLATTYVKVVPQFARTGVRNFFSNLRAPVTMVNQALQGRGDDAWDTLGRFLINTTVGVGGLFDPASADQVPKRSEDFGQTLGVWGWQDSRYVELPLFGPRTVRDVVGMGGDMPLSPIRQVELDTARIGLQGLQLVDTRAQLMAIDGLRDSALDEYAMTRDAWLQRRNYQIQQDRRGGDNEYPTVPVDAMPMPDWNN